MQTITFRHEQKHHPLALSLKEELDKYPAGLSKTKEMAAVSFHLVLLPSVTDKKLLLRTYAECVNDNNSRTGSWSSNWMISFNGITMRAMTVGSFSYEGGNFHRQSTNKFLSTSLQGESMTTAIIQHVSSYEQEVLLSVKNSCIQLSQNLKSIRGILPVTH